MLFGAGHVRVPLFPGLGRPASLPRCATAGMQSCCMHTWLGQRFHVGPWSGTAWCMPCAPAPTPPWARPERCGCPGRRTAACGCGCTQQPSRTWQQRCSRPSLHQAWQVCCGQPKHMRLLPHAAGCGHPELPPTACVGVVHLQSLASHVRRIELLGAAADRVAHSILTVVPASAEAAGALWEAVAAVLPARTPSPAATEVAGLSQAAAAPMRPEARTCTAGQPRQGDGRSASLEWLSQLGQPSTAPAPVAAASSSVGAAPPGTAPPGTAPPGTAPQPLQAAAPAGQGVRALPPRPSWQWPAGCAVGLCVLDPRLAAPVSAGACQVQLRSGQPSTAGQDSGTASQRHAAMQQALAGWRAGGSWVQAAAPLLHAVAPQCDGAGGAPATLPRPLREADMAVLRQQARRAALHLPHTSEYYLLPPRPPAEVAATHSGVALHCPVLLIRRQYGHTPGWSLIVPSGWVMPFWLALACAGEDLWSCPCCAQASGYHLIHPAAACLCSPLPCSPTATAVQ